MGETPLRPRRPAVWGEEDFTEAGNRPPIFQYRTRLFSNQTLGRLLHCHARGNPPLHNCATIRSGFDTKDGKRSFDCETGSCYIGKAYIIHSSSRSYCLSIDSFSVKSIPKAQFKSFEKKIMIMIIWDTFWPNNFRQFSKLWNCFFCRILKEIIM